MQIRQQLRYRYVHETKVPTMSTEKVSESRNAIGSQSLHDGERRHEIGQRPEKSQRRKRGTNQPTDSYSG
jgi:hypothetical protein